MTTGVDLGAASSDLDLRRYARGLLRRRSTVMAVVVVAVTTAVAFSALQPVKYEATAQVVLETNATPSLFNQSSPPPTDTQVSVNTEIQVIESPPVRTAVADKLGPVDKVLASQVGQTRVIAVHGFGRTAKRAVQVADTYAQAYLTLSKNRATEQLLAAADQIQGQINGIQTQLATIDQQSATNPNSLPSALTASRTALESEEDTLRQEQSKVQVEASLSTGGAHLVANAILPTSPVQPKPIRNIALALVAGLLLGIGLACLAEFLDDTIHTIDDVERFRPIPLLATVPAVAHRDSRALPQLALREGRATPSAEAYRALRTAVQLLGVVRPLTTLQLTSAVPGEGKTTSAANLATVLADAGRRVALVDCDLRRPMLHKVFCLKNDAGLTSVLLGEVPIAEAMQRVDDFPHLFVLTSGALAPNPSELLSLRQTAEIIRTLQSSFDVVLLDSPPLLPVTDAVVLSQWVEAVIVVTSAGSTTRKSLRRAIQVIRQNGLPLAGLVLNRAAPEQGYDYEYSYDEGVQHRTRYRHDGREPVDVGAEGHGARNGDGRSTDEDKDDPQALPPANGRRAATVDERPR